MLKSPLKIDGQHIAFSCGQTFQVSAEKIDATPDGFVLTGKHVSIEHQADEFYRHGWHSWSPTHWLDISSPVTLVLPEVRRLQCDDSVYASDTSSHHGSHVGAFRKKESRECFLLGSLDLEAHVQIDEKKISGQFEHNSVGFNSWFVCYGETDVCFKAYATKLKQKFQTDAHTVSSLSWPGPTPRVWCSWYSFFQNISETELHHQIQMLNDFPFDVIQIDDGWQKDIGDWFPNEKFKSGMADCAKRIIDTGKTPGLWFAPFLVRPSSNLFRTHPHWLLKNEQGEPVQVGFNWNDKTYALDTTRGDVQQWLTSMVQTYVAMGYTYLKIDFAYAAAFKGVRAKPTPREQAYRDAVLLLKNAAGPNVFLLLCGAPLVPSIGCAHAIRIGPDCAPFWDNPERTQFDWSAPASRNAVRTCLNRLWFSDLFRLDPDVFYFRTQQCSLTSDQKNALVTLAAACEFKATSDPINWLTNLEQKHLREFLLADPTTTRPTPMDLFQLLKLI